MSTKGNHTPGPWHIGMRSGFNAVTVFAYDGPDQHRDTPICQVSGIPLHTQLAEFEKLVEMAPERYAVPLANARLIASAPALLAALKGLLSCVDDWEEEGFIVLRDEDARDASELSLVEKARAAIAAAEPKAEGKV